MNLRCPACEREIPSIGGALPTHSKIPGQQTLCPGSGDKGKRVLRKKCAWCREHKHRSKFSPESRLGSKPGAFCKDCIGLMNALRKLRETGDR